MVKTLSTLTLSRVAIIKQSNWKVNIFTKQFLDYWSGMGNHFLLFSNCIPVKGAKRTAICDLQKNRIKLVPNLLAEVISMFREMSIVEIKSHYNQELNEGIDKYIQILEDENYGFWTNEPKAFPEIETQWDSPSIITNAIIDIDEHSQHPLKQIFEQLSDLGCICLQLRSYYRIGFDQLNEILNLTNFSRIRSIELVIMAGEYDLEPIKQLCKANKRIRSILSYAANCNKEEYIGELDVRILFTTEFIKPETHCGAVSQYYFAINIKHFTESINFNSCLNRKISVDRNGNIKNCPSSKSSFGKIKDIQFKQVLQNTEFVKIWGLNKDQILVCKDCEFRYVCTDCRAYTTDTSNPFSKPLKCSYDPYTMAWN